MNRKAHLDLLRILALFLVVFNHTALITPARGCSGSAVYWLILLADECCKLAVPLFFMVSGAVLLHREEPLAPLFRKRILRFILLILLFVAGQQLFATIITDMGWSWKAYISGCLIGNTFNHITAAHAVWFLYAYLGMLLLLPMLRCLAQHMRNSSFYLLMALQAACLIVLPGAALAVTGTPGTMLAKFLPFADATYPPFCWSHCLCYALLGYFLEHRTPQKLPPKKLAALGIAAALSLAAGVFAVHLPLGNDIDQNPFIKSFLMLPAGFVFLALRNQAGTGKQRPVIQKAVFLCASGVFAGIVTENIWRHFLLPVLYAHMGHSYPATCLGALLVAAAALVSGCIIKRIPLLGKII